MATPSTQVEQMKLNQPIKVDLLEFFQTGKFDYLENGQTKEQILKTFPDPDDFGIGNTLDTAAIWRYGNLELHFDRQELFMIYSDYIADLSGGKSVELNPWILGKTGDFSLERIMGEFNRLRMDYAIQNRLDDMTELIITKSRVKLTFHPDSHVDDKDISSIDPNSFQMGSFCLMTEK
jgi:hypothetical protein